jgi:hypothetical protein
VYGVNEGNHQIFTLGVKVAWVVSQYRIA